VDAGRGVESNIQPLEIEIRIRVRRAGKDDCEQDRVKVTEVVKESDSQSQIEP
jgi:hypothetical protein